MTDYFAFAVDTARQEFPVPPRVPPSICCAVYASVIDPDGPIYRCPLCHKSFLLQKDAAIR